MLSYFFVFCFHSYYILVQPFLTLNTIVQHDIRAALDTGNSKTNIIVPLPLSQKTKNVIFR